MIRRNVELEARLIDDLLDLTRISKGKVQLQLENVDAHQLLRNALEICEPDIIAKGLSVKTDFRATRFALHGDPARLQQVFWNLIKNAVKFTPRHGDLALNTESEDGELRVEVVDSGIGIGPELLSKIFDAFEQGERARAGGLGLGLAITKALVELHKGRIRAESEGPGRGARFIVWFPAIETATGLGVQNAPAPPSERRSMRILLVEDHEDSNRSLTQLLRRRGYEVQSAEDVQSALETAAQFDFDVLISDMGLPDGTGIDLMHKLSAIRSVFGIALTGFGMESDVQRSSAAGFQHHLIKPVDLNRLDALIQSAPAGIAATAPALNAGG
jgi:CheY-like chemotaxis protein